MVPNRDGSWKRSWMFVLVLLGISLSGCSGDADIERDEVEEPPPASGFFFDKLKSAVESDWLKNKINQAIHSSLIITTVGEKVEEGTLPWYLSVSGRPYSVWLMDIPGAETIEVESLHLGERDPDKLWSVQFTTNRPTIKMEFRTLVEGKGAVDSSVSVALRMSATAKFKLSTKFVAIPCAKVEDVHIEFSGVELTDVEMGDNRTMGGRVLNYFVKSMVGRSFATEFQASLNEDFGAPVGEETKASINGALSSFGVRCR